MGRSEIKQGQLGLLYTRLFPMRPNRRSEKLCVKN